MRPRAVALVLALTAALSAGVTHADDSPAVEPAAAPTPSTVELPVTVTPTSALPVVKLGIDVLLEDRIDLVAGKRVALVTNAGAVDGQLVQSIDRLLADPRVKLVQLYAPEHGIRAALPNGATNKTGVDELSGLPVEGLWGNSAKPSDATLAKVDVILFDLQDIGSRTYTYATTLGLLMKRAAQTRKPVIVLDRPNPLGGELFEGPIRTARRKSLIGWGPLPVTHGMTMGELAQFYQGEMDIHCPLTVVPMKGWRRDMQWEDTGLQWVPSSPGIPHALNAHFYVATGMVGGSGANVNEGGGNSMPFELIGAPFLDARRYAQELVAAGVPGILFRPFTFRPWRGQFRGKVVNGVQLFLQDRRVFRPLRTALVLLTMLQKIHPEVFKVGDKSRFARTWGRDDLLDQILAGRTWQEIEEGWRDDLALFRDQRAKYLIYR
jgi:uncharacterized protein YbbC (DUF1343 family)